jgi:hypothetical protein
MSSAREKFVSGSFTIGCGVDSLTPMVVTANMCDGAIDLVRRITTCVVLLALVGIYAAPLAAAFAPAGMDCCAAGMCPRPGHSSPRHQSSQKMPNCAMGSQNGSARDCEMGACESHSASVLSMDFFVLSSPVSIVRAAAQVAVSLAAPPLEHSVSQIPATPPPRTSLS